jgi:uncharacterized protein YwqG
MVSGFMDEFGKDMAFFPPLMGALFALITALLIRLVGVNTKYINSIKTYYSAEREERIKTGVDSMISEIMARTQVPFIKLTPKREATTVFSSKLGGMPYLPPGFIYPMNAGGDAPLRLLAQLNFEELPKLPGFPVKGILQFYVADNDMYGYNFNDHTAQKNFRVIFHESIVTDISRLGWLNYEWGEDSCFPFTGEFALYGEAEKMPMSAADFRFRELELLLYNKVFSATETQLPYDIVDRIGETFHGYGEGHHIGGYPFFTQEDPRDETSAYTTLLLQIDSGDGIIWGDSGVANFFISPEKLFAGDFSDVMYSWDCY